MTVQTLRPLTLLLALAVVACASPAPTTASSPRAAGTGVTKASPSPGGPTAVPTASAPGVVPPGADTFSFAPLAGLVAAPPTLVAAGGTNLIGTDGASIVAAGAGNVVAAGAGNVVAAGAGNLVGAGAGNYGLAQAAAPAAAPAAPVAGAWVYLMAGDRRLPIAPVKTGPDGRYSFPAVPTGLTVQVAVAIVTPGNKDGRLTALARAGGGEAADVSVASTLVAAAAVGKDPDLGRIQPAAVKAAVAQVETLLAREATAIDLAKPGEVITQAAALIARDDATKSAMGAIVAEMKAAPETAEMVGGMMREARARCAAPTTATAAPGLDWPEDPAAIAVAADGTAYLADRDRNRIVVRAPGKADAAIDVATPVLALAIAPDGELWAADAAGALFRMDAAGAKHELLPGGTFREPLGIAVQSRDVFAVADAGWNRVFLSRGPAAGDDLWIGDEKPGYKDGGTSDSRFYRPTGVAFLDGTLYVADAGNRRIRVLRDGDTPRPGGSIETLAGGAPGAMDAVGKDARFLYPAAIVAADGWLWVGDAGTGTVRRVGADGLVMSDFDAACGGAPYGPVIGGGLAVAAGRFWTVSGASIVSKPFTAPTPAATPSPAGTASPDAGGSPSPSPTPTASPTASPSASPTASPTASPGT